MYKCYKNDDFIWNFIGAKYICVTTINQCENNIGKSTNSITV